MKILLTMNLPYYPSHGGANKGNRYLLEGLAEKGHTIRVVGPALGTPNRLTRSQLHDLLSLRGVRVTSDDARDSFRVNGVEVQAVVDRSLLRVTLEDQIHEFRPDWVLVSSEDPSQNLLDAALLACPGRVVYLVHSPTFLPFGPQSFFPSPIRVKAIRQAALIVACSKSVQKYVRQHGGLESEVFYWPAYGAGPFPNIASFDKGFVTMVNPCVIKGLPIFSSLVRSLPEIEFAAVPTWGTTDSDIEELRQFPNVRLLEPSDDIEEILKQTRVLLMPSLWPEGFPLICVEAMLRGIPVVASNVAGLVESKLDTDLVLPVCPIERFGEEMDSNLIPIPIVPHQDIDPWRETIRDLLSNRPLYQKQSIAARNAAIEFVTGLSVEGFEVILGRAAGRTSRLQAPGKRNLEANETPSAQSRLVDELTPEQLAALALLLRKEEASLGSDKTEDRPIIPVSREGRLPLSFAQQRLWFIDQLEPGSAAYNIPCAVRLSGRLDERTLHRSLDEIVRRHEVFRTCFPSKDGEPSQQIHQFNDLEPSFIDLMKSDQAERQKRLQEVLGEEARRGFDLSSGPLIRAKLIRLAEDQHVLVVSMHHIVSDGWSAEIMVGEFAQLYEAFTQGKESPLPELEIQYADYAVWQRAWLQGEVLDTQLQYWKEKLDGVAVLELPTDRARPAVAGDRGASEYFRLSEELTTRLRQLSQREGVTLFMTLLAGFQALLARYSGQEDIAIGTPIAGRNRREIEGLIGFFVNTLVMRVDVGGDPTVRELLGRVRETALGAYAHQDLPFEKLVEELQPDRRLSHTPLFQVMLAFQGTPLSVVEIGALTAGVVEVETTTAKFDILLSLRDTGEELSGAIGYNSDLFDPSSIERLVEHFQELIDGLTWNPNQRLSLLPLMSEREKRQLIWEWNETAAEYDREIRIHQAIEGSAQAHPDAAAVVWEDQRISYGELERRSNQVGNYLRRQGVGPEEKVGLMMERSIELVVWMIGILKAGGAYVPIDPAYPKSRRELIVEDSRVELLVSDQEVVEQRGVRKLIQPREVREVIEEESPEGVESGVLSENLAYVIYTSGSTGKPKGVCLAHRGVIGLMKWAEGAYSGEELDGVLATTSICFDLSVYEILVALGLGGKVVLGRSGAEVREELERGEVVQINTVPSLIEGVLREGELKRSVRVVNLAGEALSRGLVEKVYERSGVERVVNLYGPSEDTTYTTMEEESRGRRERVTIGRGIENTRIYLADKRGELVPLGGKGEIYIGSESLARCYLGNGGATGERFVPEGWSGRRGERAYKTGDIGRYGAGGKIEYLGRKDHQVKVRGYRIELGEIEEALKELSGVREAVVKLVETIERGKILVGYVVEEEGKERRTDEIRRELRERLPEPMAPGVYVKLRELPKTPNGKIDRDVLPMPELGLKSEGYMPARTAVEELVCGIWAEVLGVEKVGIHDNFFELGGHSLLATQVVSRVRIALGVEAPLRTMFTNQTIAAFASEVEQQRRSDGKTPVTSIVRVGRDREPPLSFAQQRLWFIDQLEPGSAAYNIPSAVRLSGALDEQALQRSLSEIVRRHEVLRTWFPFKDGEPRQEIHEIRDLYTDFIDLTQRDGIEQKQKLQAILREEAIQGFDLSSGPLIRAKLIRLAEDEHVLAVNMHHIVSDGWSIEVMVGEFCRLYEAFTQGKESPLPELEIQYADYAVWQREWLQGEVLESRLHYWRRQLDGVAVLELPTDRARPAVADYQGASEGLLLSEELTEKLKQMSRREGVTLFMSLLAGFQVLLARYSGQQDIAVGTPIAGRNRQEIEALIGCFVNTLVMRVDLGSNPTVSELLGRVRDTALGAYAHQDLPFEKLVEELQPERSLGRTPLFQVMFTMQNAPQEAPAISGLILKGEPLEHGSTKFEMTLRIGEREGKIHGALEYATELYDGWRIRRVLERLQRVLEGMTENEQSRVMELPLMSEQEWHEVIVDWNQTAAEYPRDRCVHELFEQQLELTPDAAAVAYEGKSLTYHELNRRANQLAHYLREMGVGAEAKVGLCVEHSLEMIIGLLGVMKAGGAYLPLDADYPPERLAYLIEDGECHVTVTIKQLVEKLRGVKTKVVSLDADWPRIARQSDEKPVVSITADNLAYAIYTSGSTGRPKGVAVAHRQLVNYTTALVQKLQPTAGASFAHISTIAADLGNTMVFPSLIGGGCLHLIDQQRASDALGLSEYFGQEQIDYLKIVPSHLNALQATGQQVMPKRGLVIGGEAAGAEWIKQWGKQMPSCRIMNHYGPTETTVGALTHTVVEGENWETGNGMIVLGRPIRNSQVYLLDDKQEPVPVGVVGDLYIGGEGVARGYLNRGGETAERFIANPFGAIGSRMYRTGDRARYQEDGKIEFLGRVDDQVKIRGYRIELGEIEAALNQHASVEQVVVLAREDEPGERRLVAYLTAKEEVGSQELRAYLGAKLPEYMAPSAFVVMEKMPLTANGKIDRRALPRPEIGPSTTGYVAPRTGMEEILCEIWSEVLGVERVGVEDNFFELGGDSILSIQMIAKARQVGLQLTPRQFFERQTIAALAEIVGLGNAVEGEQGELSGEAPLTPIQRAFFEWDLAKPQHFNQAALMELKREVDSRLLEQSVQGVMKQHDALRLRYEQKDGDWIQSYSVGVADGIYRRVKISGKDEEERVRKMEKDAAARQASLSLSAGRMLQAVEYDLGEAGRMLLLIVHHLAVDRTSWRILLDDLQRGYEQLHRGEEINLGSKTASYRQWAERLEQYSRSEELREEVGYWERQRRRADEIEENEEEEGERSYATAGQESRWLSEEQTQELLQEAPEVYHMQINDVLLAALWEANRRWTGERSLVVELEEDGREEIFGDVDVSRTVGWFTSIYPVRLEAESEEIGEALKEIKELLRAIPKRGIGYGALRYLSRDAEVVGKLSGRAEAEVRFNYLGQVDQVFKTEGLLRPAPENSGRSQAAENRMMRAADVSGMVVGGRLRMEWVYSEKLHSRERIAELANHYLEALEELMEHCRSEGAGGYTPSDFPEVSLTVDELGHIIAKLNLVAE